MGQDPTTKATGCRKWVRAPVAVEDSVTGASVLSPITWRERQAHTLCISPRPQCHTESPKMEIRKCWGRRRRISVIFPSTLVSSHRHWWGQTHLHTNDYQQQRFFKQRDLFYSNLAELETSIESVSVHHEFTIPLLDAHTNSSQHNKKNHYESSNSGHFFL